MDDGWMKAPTWDGTTAAGTRTPPLTSSPRLRQEWLVCLANTISPRGETRESLLGRLQTYCDCLINEADCMTSEALKACVRRFKFFPTVAELVEFFGEWRIERKTARSASQAGTLTPALVDAMARMAMCDWWPPKGLGFWGEKHWEAWALSYAIDRVRDGGIRGRHAFRDGKIVVTLDESIDQPMPDEARLLSWRQATGHAT